MVGLNSTKARKPATHQITERRIQSSVRSCNSRITLAPILRHTLMSVCVECNRVVVRPSLRAAGRRKIDEYLLTCWRNYL